MLTKLKKWLEFNEILIIIRRFAYTMFRRVSLMILIRDNILVKAMNPDETRFCQSTGFRYAQSSYVLSRVKYAPS